MPLIVDDELAFKGTIIDDGSRRRINPIGCELSLKSIHISFRDLKLRCLVFYIVAQSFCIAQKKIEISVISYQQHILPPVTESPVICLVSQNFLHHYISLRRSTNRNPANGDIQSSF